MRSSLLSVARATAALALAAALHVSSPAQTPDPTHGWLSAADASSLETWVNARLAEEKADLDKLLAVTGPRTIENTLRPYDDAINQLTLAGNNTSLLYSLGDTAATRDAAQKLTEKVSSAGTDLSLNQAVYKALVAVPLPANDPAAKHYLERTLLQYRIAGVDKDEATRKQIRELNDKLTSLILTFGRNVADGTLKIKATREELDGLPADYIARHKPGADGTYTLTTEQPDVRPVLDFATSADLRRRMYIAYNSRAYPKNTQVLKDMLATRQQLATALGYARFADLNTADTMIGSAANIQKLFDEVDAASRPAAQKEYAELLALAKQRQPGLTEIAQSDGAYWKEQYSRAHYDFDTQSVRPYFPYQQVQAGILDTASRLFHVSFKPVSDAVVWDKSVQTYDVFDAASGSGNPLLGRIYLDMHPRDGKDKWFSAGPVIPGIRGRQRPEGMLICNFTGGTADDPGLMQYSDVVTFFHEFGHLMHYILGSQGPWAGEGSFGIESDFVEAPSQMLEEMFHSTPILQSFGKHYQTGEVIPAAVIARMNAASAFGRASDMQWQIWYSTFALQLHNQDPSTVDFDALWEADMKRFSPLTPVPGIHYAESFVHLEGYASNLYTYLFDKVIALDFFSQFDKNNLLDGPAAMRYRRSVLEPGASKPAKQLVQDFLGRPQQLDAIKSWMNEEFTSNNAASK